MPVAAQWIAEVLPATHFMRLIRGIVLRGGELSELLPDVFWDGLTGQANATQNQAVQSFLSLCTALGLVWQLVV